MSLEKLILNEGYANIKCLHYWHPKYSFSRGLRPLNCDADVVKFVEDVKGFELVDVYVEHLVEEPELVDEAEVVQDYHEGDNVGAEEMQEGNDVGAEEMQQGNEEMQEGNEEMQQGNDVGAEEMQQGNEEMQQGNDVGAEEMQQENEVGAEEMQEGNEHGAEEMQEGNDADNESEDPDFVGAESDHESSEYECDEEAIDFDLTTIYHTPNKPYAQEEVCDSDQLHTPPESGDDAEHEKYPTYRSGEGVNFQLGMVFNSKSIVREAVREYGMEKNKNIFIKKNDAKRMVILCMEGCKFYMRISKRVGNQFWQVVSLVDEHTCYRTPNNRQAKTEWLAKKFSHILRHNPDMKPAGLVAESIERWGVKLSHDQAYRAKRRAMDLIQGASMDQFSHLRSYAQELLNSNPGSNVVLQCSDSSEGPVFERIYVCLEACIYGFGKFCRPLIGLDACFLKVDFGGQLVAAVGRDGNNQIFPIAYAVVEAETKDSWEWFLNLLMEDLGKISNRAYAFISDQQKGLVPAVQKISEHVEQRLCVKHLYGNWKKKYPGLQLKEVLWSAARATTIPSWERAMLKMKTMNTSGWNDMKDTPAQHWSRSHFRTYSKCDLQVNNMCEAFNRAILEYRDKPIITLLEGIKHYLTKRITTQKELMNNYTSDICPRIQLVLEKNKKHAEHWTPTWSGDDDLAIYGVTNGNETYVVNLKEHTCACRKWQLTGIPCSHAITCIWQTKRNPEVYVSNYYSKSTFKNTYSHIVYPTNGPQLWPVDGQLSINPPVMRRAIGRPKKMRNKVNDEPRNPHVLPRKLTTVTCHKCGGMGHNKRSCKGKRGADIAIPKGGNKKAKKTAPTGGGKQKQDKAKKTASTSVSKTKQPRASAGQTIAEECGTSSQAPPQSQQTQQSEC
ncbi:uncharacterized protein LOC131640331 [Vicia villosa]|uniref:uncharacterized protein LOC131640331 n=1 Tax=Vicia villosa TaxID=3911 RepID=UPI00273BBA6C|nr:uncharacterized protein LOC131640331 [Vicia villosa]